jgi:hypothetical protein
MAMPINAWIIITRLRISIRLNLMLRFQCCLQSISDCRVCIHYPSRRKRKGSNVLTQGNCIWNSLDIRDAEKARTCLDSASYGVNLLVHCPQKASFPHREAGRYDLNQLFGLQSVRKNPNAIPLCPNRSSPVWPVYSLAA